MGSWQVVSLNCPRAAYNADGDDARLFAELKKLMDVGARMLQSSAAGCEGLIRTKHRMPFAMQRPEGPEHSERGAIAVDLEGLVYTIGVGVNEMVQHHTGKQLHESEEAFRLAIRAMTEMESMAMNCRGRTT